MMTIRGVLSLCHDFQDLDVMVKNIGYVPVVDPQWDRGRIAFKRFLPFCTGSYRIECGEARCFRADFLSAVVWHNGQLFLHCKKRDIMENKEKNIPAFFAENGITATSANHLSNIAK